MRDNTINSSVIDIQICNWPMRSDVNRNSYFVRLPKNVVCVTLVAIGDDINRDEIKGIATNEDYVFEASDFSTVQDLTEEIAARVCGVGTYQ